MNGWLTIKTRMLTGPVKQGLKDITKSLKESSKDTMAMVKSLGKMLLILGIVSVIFKTISGGIKTLLERNEELTNKIQGIKLAASNLVQGIFTAVANLLEPIVTRVINLVYTFLSYVNAITKAWFGLDLFAQKTEKNTSKTNKNLKGAAKSAKQIEKSLAGFDEVNVLNDNSSSSGGGGGGGVGSGGGNSSGLKLPEVKIPKWLQWIIDHKDDMLFVVKTVIGTLIGYKIGSKIGGLIKSIGSTKGGLIMALLTLDTILVTKIFKDIKNELIPLMGETNDLIEDTIKMTNGTKDSTDKTTTAIMKNAKAENENKKATSDSVDMMLERIDSNTKENEKLEDQIGLIGSLTGENKMNKASIEANNYTTEKYLDTLGDLYELGKLTPEQVDKYREALEKEGFRLAENNTNLKKNSTEYQKNLDKINDIKDRLNNLPKSETTTINVKADTKDARKKLSEFLSDVGKAGVQGLLGIQGSVNSAIKQIKMAKGGIVNNPGRGVAIGTNIIAGEKGAEAVIPLTDGTLQKLASMIPITIDLTNTIDGRVLNRRLETIKANDTFARNGVR